MTSQIDVTVRYLNVWGSLTLHVYWFSHVTEILPLLN